MPGISQIGNVFVIGGCFRFHTLGFREKSHVAEKLIGLHKVFHRKFETLLRCHLCFGQITDDNDDDDDGDDEDEEDDVIDDIDGDPN